MQRQASMTTTWAMKQNELLSACVAGTAKLPALVSGLESYTPTHRRSLVCTRSLASDGSRASPLSSYAVFVSLSVFFILMHPGAWLISNSYIAHKRVMHRPTAEIGRVGDPQHCSVAKLRKCMPVYVHSSFCEPRAPSEGGMRQVYCDKFGPL